MIEHTPEITELVKALSKVQSQVHGVAKDSTNPHFKNRYASLEAVIGAIRQPCLEAGLLFTQAPGNVVDGKLEITTMLMHGNQWMRSTMQVPLAKTDPQGVGSATTYGCRYSLMAMFGLPPLDDDAEAAVSHAPIKQAPRVVSSSTTNDPKSAAAYVEEAKQTIKQLANEKALKNWWMNEKSNRDKYKLDPANGPGAALMMAYGDRKAELQSDMMAAG